MPTTRTIASAHTPIIQTTAGSAAVTISGLAAHPDVNGSGGAGTSEEYDSATTGLSWSPSTPATVDSNTTILSHLYIASTDATERFGTKAWAPAGAFDARCKMSLGRVAAATIGSCALFINDSGNTNRVMLQMLVDTVTLGSGGAAKAIMTAQAYTYTSGAYSPHGTPNVIPWTAYLRITRDGSNNISFYSSDNGLNWYCLATQSFTFTVANIGFRSADNAHVAIIDWLRTST